MYESFQNEMPGVLYKYQNWNKYAENLLRSRQVHFSDPRSFNDLHDCQAGLCFDICLAKELIRDVALERFEPGSPQVSEGHFDRLVDWTAGQLFQDPEDAARRWFDFLCEHVGVLCLSSHPDNPLMWAHYAGNHTGICVGIAVDSLRTLIQETQSGIASELRKVFYTDEVQGFHLYTTDEEQSVKVVDMLFTKSRRWEYEQEYRLVLADMALPERNYCLPNNSIVEIVFGAKINTSHKCEILDLIEELELNAKLFQVVRGGFESSLRIVPL